MSELAQRPALQNGLGLPQLNRNYGFQSKDNEIESAANLSGGAPTLMYSGSNDASDLANSPYSHSPMESDYCGSIVDDYAPSTVAASADERNFSGFDNEDEDEDEEEEEEEEDQEAIEEISSDDKPERSASECQLIEEEITLMEQGVAGLNQYVVIDKLGSGTFSSVYKAFDKNHYLYDNSSWTNTLPGPPPIKRTPKNVYVALKRIYVSSSPARILNELEILEELRNCRNISYLITAFRTEDQIIAVMPYSRHKDFREYYRIMPLSDLKCYFRCLFNALKGVHAHEIIHRDVKPANFLYDPRTGEGTLCDFGLAERFQAEKWEGKCHHSCPNAQSNGENFGHTFTNKTIYSTHLEVGGAMHDGSKLSSMNYRKKAMGPPEQRPGVLKDDNRQSVRANRAGTRGFRAPEVLFKCMDQTMALDIWSAGIILLAFLTKRFPMFNSNDDTEALLELTVIFGRRRMVQCALLHNRTFNTNLPSEASDGWRIPAFILRLNPDILTPPRNHPDPKQYEMEVHSAMQLCQQCLQLDLTKRCSAAAALQHQFLAFSEWENDSGSGGSE